MLEYKCEDETTSATSYSFYKSSQQEFKDLATQINQEDHELLTELLNTLDDIMETHVYFGKMYVTLEEQESNREQASKAYDDIVYQQRYMNDRVENITILSSFHWKKVRTILHAWLDLNRMIEDTIQKAHVICGRRLYDVDNILEKLHFPTMDLIENVFPPKLMIEQIEC